jgi:hypothetical protein
MLITERYVCRYYRKTTSRLEHNRTETKPKNSQHQSNDTSVSQPTSQPTQSPVPPTHHDTNDRDATCYSLTQPF